MRACILLLLSVIVFSFSACDTPSEEETNTPIVETETKNEKTFDIHRGINISHWLSQSDRRGAERKAYFTEKDVMAIAAAGFDHIRIPIDEVQMWEDTGNKETLAFDLLHEAIGWAEKHSLKVLVDLHIIRSHYFLDADPPLFTDPAEQAKFADLWAQLSAELNQYSTENVAYELLNESVAKDPEDWNKVYRIAYDEVRKNEQERVIFIGSNRWQQAATFPDLRVPENDPNIVLSFHFYSPHVFTHYKASWDNIRHYTGPVHYPGTTVAPEDTIELTAKVKDIVRHYASESLNKAKLEEMMQPAIQKADSLGLQLYCGEFGCLKTVPDDARQRWFTDIFQIFEENNIAWTNWDYKSGQFGMFNPEDLSLELEEEIVFVD